MERYLKESLLEIALGANPNLPSKESLAESIAQIELDLLIRSTPPGTDLMNTAWYLFTVASVKDSIARYGIERQRAAYQVAGHIFDLCLATPGLELKDKYSFIFAAQISYIRSSHHPNAIAILRKNLPEMATQPVELQSLSDISLQVGLAFLGFDVRFVYQSVKSIQKLIARLEEAWQINSIYLTPFGAAYGLAVGCKNLLSYLVHGKIDYFEKAKASFLSAIRSQSSYEDVDCKWMASLLLEISDELKTSSPWTVLPSTVPDNVKKAFTLGSPRVLSLWPPQIDYLGKYDPFADNARFQFISTPTSGGKTLISQIILAHHLATRFTSACYIAPTRSLCREVEASMKSRFKYLNLKAGMLEIFDGWLSEEDIVEPEIIISTPEALAGKLRSDADSIFSKVKLFVFDEAHSIGESGRGLNMEQVISLLKSVASNHDIRIVMVSAVIGNRSNFITWLGAGSENQVLETHSDWRGPRRINAIWSNDTDWNLKKEVPMKVTSKSIFKARRYYDLHGTLTVRTSLTGNTTKLRTVEAIGDLVMKVPIKAGKKIERDEITSIGHNESLIPLISMLVQRGPILCIEATKLATITLAKDVADSREDSNNPQINELVNIIEGKLSVEHPLSRVIRKGVAYHHSSLPNDIKNEIESAVTSGIIDVLVATTTMTEGVNLPVQAVIISHTGTHQNDKEFLQTIRGPKMANAIGRAGRATKETEGCVVLCHKGKVDASTFKAIDPDDHDKFVASNLTSEEVFRELEAYEEMRLLNEKVIFDFSGQRVSDFISFVWFYLHLNSKEGDVDPTIIQNILPYTMFWIQSDDNLKLRIQSLMGDVVKGYNQATPFQRKLLAKSSSKLKSTLVLREAFEKVVSQLLTADSSVDVLTIIFKPESLELILAIVEAPKKPIFNQRSGKRSVINIDLLAFLNDWINGAEYPDLASKFMGGVSDVDFRYEQLGDFISNYFDNFFPWVIRLFIDWTNELTDEETLPHHIPGLIRAGVPTKAALTLTNQGIPSRSLAVKITNWITRNYSEVSDYEIRNHLRNFMLKDLYGALSLTPVELKYLTIFLTEERVQILSSINSKGECDLVVWLSGEPAQDGPCEVSQDETGMNFHLIQRDKKVGHIPTRYHSEMDALIQGGIPVIFIIKTSESKLEIYVED